jgi:colicin import membrane protein
MSDTRHNKQKPEMQAILSNKTFVARGVEQFRLLPQKKLLLASCLLHIVFFSLLFMNWHNQDPIKPIHIPENIQARVVSLDELKELQTRKDAEQKAIQDQLNREKLLAEQKRLEIKEKQQAIQKAKELEQKKIVEQKKKEAEKQLQIKKQKEEQAKLEKEKKLKELEAKKKQEVENKRKAEAEKKLADQKIAEQKALELKQQENKMLERLQQVEKEKALLAQQAKALALENERKRQEQQFLDYELTEKERYMARIKTQIEGLWRIPPKSEGLKITLSIKLLPNGELASVNIINSSGNSAFDNSALLAVKSVRRFLVPEDNKVFERNFRQFNMSFSPE